MQKQYLTQPTTPPPRDDAQAYDVIRASFSGMSCTIAEDVTLQQARDVLARRVRSLRRRWNTEVSKIAELEYEATDLGEGLIGDHHGIYFVRVRARA